MSPEALRLIRRRWEVVLEIYSEDLEQFDPGDKRRSLRAKQMRIEKRLESLGAITPDGTVSHEGAEDLRAACKVIMKMRGYGQT